MEVDGDNKMKPTCFAEGHVNASLLWSSHGCEITIVGVSSDDGALFFKDPDGGGCGNATVRISSVLLARGGKLVAEMPKFAAGIFMGNFVPLPISSITWWQLYLLSYIY